MALVASGIVTWLAISVAKGTIRDSASQRDTHAVMIHYIVKSSDVAGWLAIH